MVEVETVENPKREVYHHIKQKKTANPHIGEAGSFEMVVN